MVLLGRDRLLAWGAGAWRDATNGRGRVLLLSGEAGIGKTTLARAIVEHAGGDAAVRWGSCWDGGRVPLAAWIDALRMPGDDECAAVAAELADPATARRDLADIDPVAEEREQMRVVAAVVDALRAAGRRMPQLVVLDDIHWADAATVRVLRAVAAHAPAMRVLIVATYRGDEIPADSPILGLGGGADHLAVPGLTEPEVGRLLSDVLDRVPSAQEQLDVFRQTAGNPLFVAHVGRLLSTGSSNAVPAGIAEVLGRRLARLPSECDQALGAASVLGHEFDVAVVAQMSGASADETLDALDHAISARVAGPIAGSARRWSFTHALVQAARYDALGSLARADLHRRAFDVLSERAETPAAVLAHHGARGRFDADDPRPAEAMIAAADDAAHLAGDDAIEHYGEALALAPSGAAGDELRARAHLGLGRVRMRRGDGVGAGDDFAAAAAIARVLRRPELLAHAALGFGAGLGGFEVRMLDRRQAELLEEAAATLDAGSPLRPWVLARLSCALTLLGTTERRLDLADDALAAARAANDPAAIAAALAARCDVISGPAFVDERVAASDEIIAIGEQLPDRGVELLGRRLRVVTLAERCELRALDAEVVRFERSAALLGDPLYSWYVPLWRAMRSLGAGRIDEARRLADEARRTGTQAGSANAQVLPLVVELYAALATDDRDELRRLIGVLVDDLSALLLANGTPMLLWVDVMFGATDGAQRTRALVEDVDKALAVDAEWVSAMAPLADLVFDLGLDDLAAPLYERLSPFPRVGVVEGIAAAHRGPVARWLTLLAAQLGDADAFARHAADALELAARCGAHVLSETQEAVAAARRRLEAPRVSGRAPTATATRPVEVPPPPSAAIVRRGDAWEVTWDGTTVHVRHAKGLADLANLLEREGREVHVRELEGAVVAGATRGDAALDATALAQYRARLRDLEVDLDDADRGNDIERSARLAAERDAVVAELARSLGRGGRVRRSGSDPDERLRKAVSARVKASIDRLEALHPALGRHLRSSIRTGFWCSYAPEHPTPWRIER